MSTTSLMSLGVQAMTAAQIQLKTTSNNITNASVDGYSRQSARLETVAGQYTGSGYIGSGVSVTTVTRAVNRFLTDQVAHTGAQASADSSRLQMLSQLEGQFGLGEQGLGQAAAKLFSAFGDVSAAPSDPSARQVALARATDVADLFRSTSAGVARMQTGAVEQVKDAVSQVNGMARDIASLNARISDANAGGHSPNDLLDQRDQLISQLSQQIPVSRIDNRGADGQADGTVSLFVGGGQTLVLGAQARPLSAVADVQDSQRVRLLIDAGGSTRELPAGSIGGGALGGLMQFQNEDLTAARNGLGQLAAAFADVVNQQHAQGTDQDGQPGQPLLALSAPQALPSSRNVRDASGQFAATVQVTRVAGQGAQLQASDYELRTDPADASRYQLTRLSDGHVFSGLANGAQVDGFKFDVGTTPMAAQDRFLLQPVAGAADAVTVALTSGRQLAAAGATAAGAGNANALKLQAMGDTKSVLGSTFTDAHARLIADVGVRVQSARAASTASTNAASQARDQLGAETGVNLDEEAARLLQFQQSYQAAAKVLTTAQKIFDTLLSMVG